MQPGEIIVSVDIPTPFPATLRFYKVTKRRLDDISTVAAAFALDLDEGSERRVRRARFAFGGMAATPVRVTAAEQAVEGQPWNETSVARAQDAIIRTLTPLSDARGSREYRLAVATSLLAKFHWEAQR